VLLVGWAVHETEPLMKIMVAWSMLCMGGIIFSQYVFFRDKDWMALPIAFYLPYWLIYYLIPTRRLYEEGYLERKVHLVSDQYWPQATHLASLSISAFMIGFYILAKRVGRGSYVTDGKTIEGGRRRIICITAWILLIATTVTFIQFMMKGGINLYGGGYVHVGHLEWGARASSIAFETCFRAAVCAWSIYIILGSGFSWRNVVPVLVLGGMLSAFIWAGDRDLLVWAGICAIVVLAYRRPIRWYEMGAALVVGGLVLAFVENYRAIEVKTMSEAANVIKEDVGVSKGLAGFSESLAPTVTNAFALVDEQGHFGGVFFMQNLAGIIPLYSSIFPWLPSAKDSVMSGTGAYITDYVFGYHPYGLATTIVTDLYVDFPYVGVVAVMTLYGLFAGALYRFRGSGKYMEGLFSYALLLPGFMAATRGSGSGILRMTWSILLYLCVVLSVVLISRTRSVKSKD